MNEDKVIEIEFWPYSDEWYQAMNMLAAIGDKETLYSLKLQALRKLNIEVQPGQTPLGAWTLAMCRKNGLPEKLPAYEIGQAAQEICPKWLWWLA